MLLRTLFVALAIAALAETAVHGAHALAQTALHRRAITAVREELVTGTTIAQRAVARAIADGADPRVPNPVAPSPSPVCRVRFTHGCAIEASVSISFRSPDSGNTDPSPCPSGACTIYEQANDVVREGRIEAVLAAAAINSTGAVLARSSHVVTLRTFAAPPYVAVAGIADSTEPVEMLTVDAADDGGAAPNGAAPGTLIDVVYRNATTGATLPANVWRARPQNRPAQPAAWSP